MAAYNEHPEYADLITSEHADAPKYRQLVDLLASSIATTGDALKNIQQSFDLDTAVGAQLEIIGQWVGINRNVRTPITGIYFTWGDSTTPHSTGWGYGVWKGYYDPATGIQKLDDDIYRRLIYAKIELNQWDGTVNGIYAALNKAFPDIPGRFIVQDNQDMSMIIGVSGGVIQGLYKSVLIRDYLPIRPAGVQFYGYRFVTQNAPLFAWGNVEGYFNPPANAAFYDGSDWVLADGENLQFVIRTEINAGWGTGAWGELHYGA